MAPLVKPGGPFEDGFPTLRRLLEEVGLPFRMPERIPRTRLALECSEWVRRHAPAAFPAFHRSLFLAHWAQGWDISDRNLVLDLAREAEVDGEALETAIHVGQTGLLVDTSTAEAVDLGVAGTPAYLFGGQFMLPGNQTHEVLDRVVARLRERGVA